MGASLWSNIFFMLGGVAVLMFGMKIMGSNLEQVAGNNMKALMGKMTNNRFAGVGVGALVTAIINSSTATTVMLVGFVNVGLMTLTQATSVIMGANIGTTITALILAFTGSGFEIEAVAALICAIGISITIIFKKDKFVKIGNILVGIGLIFIGLKILSLSVRGIIYDDFKEKTLKPVFNRIFQGEIFPLVLVIIGLILTALVHSSAAITGILIALGSALKFESAMFIILGSNIGTCVTSLVSSIGTNTNAKRTAVIHLLFNLFGCIICIVPVWIFGKTFADFMIKAIPSPEWRIALFHLGFNLITTIILMPFIKPLVLLASKIVPESKKSEEKHKLTFIDTRLLETPPIAVSNTKKEILKMSDIAKENFSLAMSMLLDSEIDETELFKENEDALNFLNKSITEFLTKIMGKSISDYDEKRLGTYFHVVSDLERIGDYSENIVEYSEKLRELKAEFSDDAKYELVAVKDLINKLFEKGVETFRRVDKSLFAEVDEIEQQIDDSALELENRHIERLKTGQCSPEIGSIYLQTVSDLERIGDHITNVSYSIKNYRHR
ncbi:MAG: Na/Pi cotransporter family protein [Clostridia bacterium]|nr:Na/Pi cotransporter family protein [Clostridia bacterium]